MRGECCKNTARLVSQGHYQEEGIVYDDVFASCTRIEGNQVIWPLPHLWIHSQSNGIKSAIQYGTIDEEYIFQMSSMGELNSFLRSSNQAKQEGIFISQDNIKLRYFKKFDLCDCQSCYHSHGDQVAFDKDDDAFDVTLKTSHLNAVKRIFKYLKGKPHLGLWYPRDSPLDLEALSDSDYGGSNLDRKSATGGCQFLGQRLISWQCKKQTIVATSTTEAEYVAAANCYGQVLWVQNQLL
ncbi:hypothetical protein Tco_0596406 [Tanacetum coccineum]